MWKKKSGIFRFWVGSRKFGLKVVLLCSTASWAVGSCAIKKNEFLATTHMGFDNRKASVRWGKKCVRLRTCSRKLDDTITHLDLLLRVF